MAAERTFIAIKPDGAQRGLLGEVISRFERRGYLLVAAKFIVPSYELLKEHYAEHKGRPFLPALLKYMSSGPVMAMVWEGENIVANSRDMIGATDPKKAAPGTIRGDFAQAVGRNIIHGSDSAESAAREISLWFKPEEQAQYQLATYSWVHE